MTKKPKMLLHACCGPCSSSVIERLEEEFDLTIYFFNPNIMPKGEYDKRFDELIKFLNKTNRNYVVVNAPYSNDTFKEKVKGREGDNEGGRRCEICIEYRMEETAKYAKEHNYDIFTTTLSVSPHKNAEYINKIGKELEEKYDIKYLTSNFKKQNGFLRSIELSKEYNIYRQNYCGCRLNIDE